MEELGIHVLPGSTVIDKTDVINNKLLEVSKSFKFFRELKQELCSKTASPNCKCLISTNDVK